MKPWLAATLVIVPAGLAMGLYGARMVNSGTPRDEPGSRSAPIEAAGSTFGPGDALEPPDVAADDPRQEDARGRPALNWEEEYWPDDHRGYGAGPYSYDDDDYFGRAEGGEAAGEDRARGSSGAGEVASAARAAERAARDAVRAGAARPADRASPDPLPAPSDPPPPPPSEPRTADGDLPAIW